MALFNAFSNAIALVVDKGCYLHRTVVLSEENWRDGTMARTLIPEPYVEATSHGLRVWKWSTSSNSYVLKELSWEEVRTSIQSRTVEKTSSEQKRQQGAVN